MCLVAEYFLLGILGYSGFVSKTMFSNVLGIVLLFVSGNHTDSYGTAFLWHFCQFQFFERKV